MGANSSIEWTHHTFNAWRGCTKVSTGCKNCYAETLSRRNPAVLGMWGPMGTRSIAADAYWQQPLKWNEEAKEAGEQRRVFCASLADVFEGPESCQIPEQYEAIQQARQRLFNLARRTNRLDWLFLTKRPQNIRPILSQIKHESHPHTDFWTLMQRQPIANWWFGTSVEDQEAANTRIPFLLDVPAVVRFLSCEPLLGPVDLRLIHAAETHGRSYQPLQGCWQPNYRRGPDGDAIGGAVAGGTCGKIHWVIAGGESGPGARPMHPVWAQSLRDQCASAGIAFFFKQHGEYVCSEGAEALGDIQFRSDGVITGKVTKVTLATNPTVKAARQQAAAQEGHNGFGLTRLEIPIGVDTKTTVEHDERKGRYTYLRKVGKHDAGRLLDGVVWDQIPTPFAKIGDCSNA